MEQFSLEKYLENPNRKVVTRDGRSVRIICTDAKGKLPIIALVPFGDSEDAYHYNKNGVANGFESITLFFADEEEELTPLTEFEKELQIIISEASHWTSDDGSISTYCQFGDKEIKRISEQLLDLARKELLKDLPKWKRANVFVSDEFGLATRDDDLIITQNGYQIKLSDLMTLPKEE